MGRQRLEKKREHVIKAYITSREYLHLKLTARQQGIRIPELIRKAITDAETANGSAITIVDELRGVTEKIAQVCDYLLQANGLYEHQSCEPLSDLDEHGVNLFYMELNGLFSELKREFKNFKLN